MSSEQQPEVAVESNSVEVEGVPKNDPKNDPAVVDAEPNSVEVEGVPKNDPAVVDAEPIAREETGSVATPLEEEGPKPVLNDDDVPVEVPARAPPSRSPSKKEDNEEKEEEDGDVEFMEDTAGDTNYNPLGNIKRTKIVFFDSSDDDAPADGEAKAPVVAEVNTGYLLTTDPTDMEATEEELIEEAFARAENPHRDSDNDETKAADEQIMKMMGGGPPLLLGAQTLRHPHMMDVPEGFGTETKADLERKERRRMKRARKADRPTTDPDYLVGKKKKFEDDEEGEEAITTDENNNEQKVVPHYNLTLNEYDVQDEFSSEEDEEDEDEDFDDEEEEERMDRVIAVAAIVEAVRTCEDDEEFAKDVKYQAFAAKAKDALDKLDNEEITDEAFIELMQKDMLHMKRVHARTMRPPKDAPIIVDGVLCDL